MTKRVNWKSKFESAQNELDVLKKISPQVNDQKKFQLAIIRIERIHYVVAICIALLTLIQSYLFNQQNSLSAKQLKQLELQSDLFQNQNQQIRLQNEHIANQTELMSIQKDQIDVQNQLVDIQTNKLEQQTILSESDRRSSLIFLMSNVMDKLDDELKSKEVRSLSKELTARVIALSNSFKPYYILEKNEISKKMLSPERGQLLVALIKTNLESRFFSFEILAQSNFSYSDLREADLRAAWLTNARLSNSNFSKAVLAGTDFSMSVLNNSDFSGADLRNTNFKSANLCNVNFENADLSGATFDNSIMNANLKGAIYDKRQFDSVIKSCPSTGG